MTDGDIHNRGKKAERTLTKIQNEKRTSQHNIKLITQFNQYLASQGLSQDRISRYLYTWRELTPHLDFQLDNPSKDDLIKIVGKINQNNIKEKDIAESTKSEYKKAIRKFYTDFIPNYTDTLSKDEPEQLVDFFTITTSSTQVDPDRLPRPKHVKSLVKHADRARDKAFIMTLWSTAGRVGEILGLKWKDVRFQDDIAKVKFRDTKTGGDRIVPMHAGFLYLKRLKEQDHKGDDPEAFVFRGIQSDEQLSYQGGSMIVKRARSRADIPDRIKTNPHAFRKGRATYLAAKGMNQAQLCKFGGWVMGSPVVAKYIRIAESDVEAGIRNISGLEENNAEPEEDLKPVKCHDCSSLNTWEADNCTDCGTILTTSRQFKEAQIEETKEQIKDELIKEQKGLDKDWIQDRARELVKERLNQ